MWLKDWAQATIRRISKFRISLQSKMWSSPGWKESMSWVNLENWRLLILKRPNSYQLSSRISQKNHFSTCPTAPMTLPQGTSYGCSKNSRSSKRWESSKKKVSLRSRNRVTLQQSESIEASKMPSSLDLASKAWCNTSNAYLWWRKSQSPT